MSPAPVSINRPNKPARTRLVNKRFDSLDIAAQLQIDPGSGVFVIVHEERSRVKVNWINVTEEIVSNIYFLRPHMPLPLLLHLG